MYCQAVTKAGFGCRHKAKNGIVMCGKHETKEHGQCIGLNETGKRCMKVGPLCEKHRAEQQVIKDEQFAEAMWDRLMDDFDDRRDMTYDEMEMRIQFSYEAGALTFEWRTRLLQRIAYERQADEYLAQRQEEVPMYLDNQNVHRAVISDQTNRGMDILLAQPVPEGQETLTEIWVAWGNAPHVLKEDMLKWYNQSSCRHTNDWLYKRALDGLWSMILNHKDKEELLGRLGDECDEAFQTCCEGHLCRLVNTMVGFDERFEVHVSKKEQLQQRMAEISMQDISTEQKALDAWKWMEDNGIPEEERKAWIDAF